MSSSRVLLHTECQAKVKMAFTNKKLTTSSISATYLSESTIFVDQTRENNFSQTLSKYTTVVMEKGRQVTSTSPSIVHPNGCTYFLPLEDHSGELTHVNKIVIIK